MHLKNFVTKAITKTSFIAMSIVYEKHIQNEDLGFIKLKMTLSLYSLHLCYNQKYCTLPNPSLFPCPSYKFQSHPNVGVG